MSKRVHVVGTGTIGEPLIGLLTNFKKDLGISEVTFTKRSANQVDRPKVKALTAHGAAFAGRINQSFPAGQRPPGGRDKSLQQFGEISIAGSHASPAIVEAAAGREFVVPLNAIEEIHLYNHRVQMAGRLPLAPR